MRLPAYTGSAWRGLLGRCLRQTVCVTRQPRCDGCLLLRTCVYSTFFESPAASPEIGHNPLLEAPELLRALWFSSRDDSLHIGP